MLVEILHKPQPIRLQPVVVWPFVDKANDRQVLGRS